MIEDCPTACAEGLSLCNDGTCSSTSCDENLESPCACEALNFTCAKVVAYYDTCQSDFGDFYNSTAECLAEEEAAIPQLSLTGPLFLLCYYWISGVTFAVIVFCFLNQKVFPVQASVQTLTPISHTGDEWKQTGYKVNIVGYLINLLVWTTLWGIQALLLILTIFYYMQQEAVTRWPPVFQDEVQVLTAFE